LSLVVAVTCFVSKAYLPHLSTGSIVGAAWADKSGCDCQYSNSQRGCSVVTGGVCGSGWISQCQTQVVNPPVSTCIKIGGHPCGENDPQHPQDCGFIENEGC
jgi:hypothetical protein